MEGEAANEKHKTVWGREGRERIAGVPDTNDFTLFVTVIDAPASRRILTISL